MSTGLQTAVTGTLPEKTAAFQQMASAASAGMFPDGYDTVQKVMAAAWAADALGVHPVSYMQSVYVARFNGKTRLMPKWTFKHALLKARLPGYQMVVVEETEEACEITMKCDGDEQTVRYTMEDAERQEFAKKDTYRAHSKEMLFKQAFHRCAERIGAHVLGGIASLHEFENVEFSEDLAPKHERSVAAVIDEAIEDAEPAKPPIDWHKRLTTAITGYWGKGLKKAEKMQKYALVMKEITGGEWPVPKRADEIGPADAERAALFIEEKIARGSAVKDAANMEVPPPDPEPAVEAAAEPEAEEAEEVDDDVPPPVGADEVVESGERERYEQDGKVETVFALVKSLRKKFPNRPFVKEAPSGSTVWWLYDQQVVHDFGLTTAIKLMKNGEQAVDPDLCRKIVVYLREMGGVA